MYCYRFCFFNPNFEQMKVWNNVLDTVNMPLNLRFIKYPLRGDKLHDNRQRQGLKFINVDLCLTLFLLAFGFAI